MAKRVAVSGAFFPGIFDQRENDRRETTAISRHGIFIRADQEFRHDRFPDQDQMSRIVIRCDRDCRLRDAGRQPINDAMERSHPLAWRDGACCCAAPRFAALSDYLP